MSVEIEDRKVSDVTVQARLLLVQADVSRSEEVQEDLLQWIVDDQISCRRLTKQLDGCAVGGLVCLGHCEAWFPFRRKRLRCHAANHGCHCFDRAFLLGGACVFCVKISRNKRKHQPIGMLGRSSGNHDRLLSNASDCV